MTTRRSRSTSGGSTGSRRGRPGRWSWSRRCPSTSSGCSTSGVATASSPPSCWRRGPRRSRRSGSTARLRCSIWPASGSPPSRGRGSLEHDLDRPLPDLGTFDVVVSGFAIHHLEDERKQALLAEVADVLRPGGVFANLEVVHAPPTSSSRSSTDASSGRAATPRTGSPPIEPQLDWMRDAGLVQVDCQWRWRGFASSSARRRRVPLLSTRSPLDGDARRDARHRRPTRIAPTRQEHVRQRREGAADEGVLAAGHGVGHLGLEVADAGPGEGAVGVRVAGEDAVAEGVGGVEEHRREQQHRVRRNRPAAIHEWRGRDRARRRGTRRRGCRCRRRRGARADVPTSWAASRRLVRSSRRRSMRVLRGRS